MDFNDEEIRILLVEDQQTLADATRRLLAEVGEVTWVRDADSALQLLLTGDWNIVIVELELPRMDGAELLRAIRSHDPAPVALALGDAQRFDHVMAAIRAGASGPAQSPGALA